MSGHNPRQLLYPGAMSASTTSQASSVVIPNSALPISEQLMQLDQAITLTLQEIDQNFATAHQTVTSRILPAINKYGVASARIWQGAKFWKHFFEVSANVSLSARNQGDETEEDENTSYEHGSSQHGDSESHTTFASDDVGGSPQSTADTELYDEEGNESLLASNVKSSQQRHRNIIQIGDDSGEGNTFYSTLDRARASSPPRFSNASMAAAARREADKKKQQQQTKRKDQGATSFDPTESPFERLRREVAQDIGQRANDDDSIDASAIDAHQKQKALARSGGREQSTLADGIENLNVGDASAFSSIAPPPRLSKPGASSFGSKKTQSTPKGKGPLLRKVLNSEQRKKDTRGHLPKVDATPKGSADRNPFAQPASLAMWNGIVDLRKTPLNPKMRKRETKGKNADTASEWDSEEDENDSFAWPAGMSPPVTMQFSVPQSKYAKTPAKEAARLMVEDLLKSVGGSRMTGQPNARAPLAEQQVQHPSSEESPVQGSALKRGPLPSSLRAGPIGTPLRKGKKEAKEVERAAEAAGFNKRRDSMPTPPTMTKRNLAPPKPRLSTTPNATPSAGSYASTSGSGLRKGPTDASGAGSAAALLMDQGEGLESDEVPANLGTKLSAVALSAPGGVDRMLPPEDDYDDEDDDDDDDSFEDEDDDPPAASILSSAAKQSDSGGWTSSTISSFNNPKQAGRSIEDDTLFGVRKPQQPESVPKNPFREEGEFKVWGQVDEMGTVHAGRPLIDRDDTYSAPSPTPMHFQQQAGRK